jgi:hypothetical protein
MGYETYDLLDFEILVRVCKALIQFLDEGQDVYIDDRTVICHGACWSETVSVKTF